jgi:hypothetical protein
MKKFCGFFAFLVLLIGIGIMTPQTVEAKDSSTYYIKVNRQQNCITIYKKDSSGNYTVPVKAMACSVGLNGQTPTGTFSLGGQYRWHELMGEVYGQYCSRITGGVLFHSVFYSDTDPSKLYYTAYNKLGTTASHGCVRLTVADAKWIYDNCGSGTKVTIYDSSEVGPLGKPTTMTISASSPYRGWDPTDPNKKNPWRKVKPSFSGLKSKTVERLSTVNLKKGVTAADYKGKKLKYTVSGKVNAKKTGKYKITYTATDSIGNSTSKTITITVKDTKKPSIKATEKTLTFTEAMTGKELLAAVRANFTATDSGETLDAKYIKIEEEGLTALKTAMKKGTYGDYVLKVYSQDKAGNKSKKTISITIKYVDPNATETPEEPGTETPTTPDETEQPGDSTGTDTSTGTGTETGTEQPTEQPAA